MTVSTYQQRIADMARRSPGLCFKSIHHYLDEYWLAEAFRRTRKDGAVGVDGQTWEDYAVNLTANLKDLRKRVLAGEYQAPPVRRAYIPKDEGAERRPIGIPTLEDKVLQRAVLMLLEPIYEQTFLECSYGFRRGRSVHKALDTFRQEMMGKKLGWIYEVDVKSYFDRLDHGKLRGFLDLRVRDGVVRRLIDKWLKAGVLEDGKVTYPETGTPQGGVISPLLANIFLHYVLDEWFTREVSPRMRGNAVLTRYADDFILGFQYERDARRVMEVLPKRLERYGLTVHPDKSRLVRYERPGGPGGPPETFDFLGFRHYWGRSRRGSWVVKRKTAPRRFTRSLRKLVDKLRKGRHKPPSEQHAMLSAQLRGCYGAWGITGNFRALQGLLHAVQRAWHKWWNRRGGQRLNWDTFQARVLENYPLPRPRIVHPAVAKP